MSKFDVIAKISGIVEAENVAEAAQILEEAVADIQHREIDEVVWEELISIESIAKCEHCDGTGWIKSWI